MRRSYQYRKLERHARKPAELLLVPMIDIFTVLVTFLLMTAVFSRTVILQLNLPASQTEFREPPPGLDAGGAWCARTCCRWPTATPGRWHTVPNTAAGYDYDGLDRVPEAREGQVPGEDRCHHPARARHRL